MSEGNERRRRTAFALTLSAVASASFLLGWAKHGGVASPTSPHVAQPLEIGRRRLSALGMAKFKDPKSMSLRSSRGPSSSGFPAEEERYASVGGPGGRKSPSGEMKRTVDLQGGEVSSTSQAITPDSFENEMGEYHPPPSDEDVPNQTGKASCVPAKMWHSLLHVNCNAFHEIDHGLDDGGAGDHGSGHISYLSAGGRRDTYAYQRSFGSGPSSSGGDGWDRVVVKLLRMEKRDWTERCFDLQRHDAVALERVSSSPHVINTYGFCGTSTFNEFAGGGNAARWLLEHGENVNPDELLILARNFSIGLADVHDIGVGEDFVEGDAPGAPADLGTVMQADLRTFNLLITGDGEMRLSDFNAANFLQWDVEEQRSCGFPAGKCGANIWGGDRSPEECMGEKPLTQKIEVYHMGSILHLLLSNKKYPFISYESKDRKYCKMEGDESNTLYDVQECAQEMKQRTIEGEHPPLPPEVLESAERHPQIRAIIEARDAAMTYSAEERPTARGVANILVEAAERLGLA